MRCDLHTSQAFGTQHRHKHLRQGDPVDYKLPIRCTSFPKAPSLSLPSSNQHRIVTSFRQFSPDARIVSWAFVPHASDHILWHGSLVSRPRVIDWMVWEVTPGVDPNDLQRVMNFINPFVQRNSQPVLRVDPIFLSPMLKCRGTMAVLILLGSSDLVVYHRIDEPNARRVRSLHHQSQSFLTCHVGVYTRPVAHDIVARPLVVDFWPR
jgi:hypothetical protein